MLKALPVAIGGIAGTGFFGTWGISQATNSSKNNGMKWLRSGTDVILDSNKRNKGMAIKIPNGDFKLSCEKLNNNEMIGCNDLQKKLEEVQSLAKTATSAGFKNYVKDNDQSWLKDKDCGEITWGVDALDQKTNLLLLAKFLLRVYCFKSREKNENTEFKKELIDNINKTSNSSNQEELVGGIFNHEKIWENSGKALKKSEIKENLERLINKRKDKLTKWIDILSKLTENKLNLRVNDNSRSREPGKWLIIQKINSLS